MHALLRKFRLRLRQAKDAKKRTQLYAAFKSIGPDLELEPPLEITYPERITLGHHVYIGPRAQLHARGHLHIEDYAIIGPEVVILTSSHHYKNADMLPYGRNELLNPVRIGQCTWIGVRVIILPGVNLGEGAIVGAGAVVTKSCPPGAIIAGNPAQVIGHRDMHHYRDLLARRQFFWQNKHASPFEKIEIPVNPT